MPYPQTFWDSPGAFPMIISIILILICFVWLFDILSQQKKKKKGFYSGRGEMENQAIGEQKQNEALKKKRERRQFIIISILVIAYLMVLMPLLPFPTATFIFLTACFLIFSKTKWWKLLINSGSFSLAIYLIFIYVLRLPMPR